MSKQQSLLPVGLTRSQFARLSEFSELAEGYENSELLRESDQHLQRTLTAYAGNRLINQRLATAIHDAIKEVIERWESVPSHARTWLAGAILYFAKCNDDEPDLNSPIGFEDDAEVLNACLQLAHLHELRLNVEDYDDA